MKQFRTVKRKANVGERILITNRDSEDDPYRNGDVLTVKGVGRDGVNYKTAISGFVFHEEYEVIIEEVNQKEENEMESKQLTDYSYEELLDAIKAKAQAEVEIKAQKETLVQFGHSIQLNGEEIAKALNRLGNAARRALKTPQQQRDEIIEQAKRDVAELESMMDSSFRPPINGNNTFMEMRTFVKFFVNKEKRAVTALVYCCEYGYLVEKGIAKCAPTDCFNVHIGRAIALRRALGLDVPSEYLNAPQPTEVRVGDVVEIHRYDKSVCGNYSVVSIESDGWLNFDDGSSSPFRVQDGDRIIDDSREGE